LKTQIGLEKAKAAVYGADEKYHLSERVDGASATLKGAASAVDNKTGLSTGVKVAQAGVAVGTQHVLQQPAVAAAAGAVQAAIATVAGASADFKQVTADEIAKKRAAAGAKEEGFKPATYG